MGFQDLKKVLKNKFKIEREIEQTGNDVFRGDLYKNEYYNDYCFIKLRMKFCEISFFKCDSRKFEKIEDELIEAQKEKLQKTKEANAQAAAPAEKTETPFKPMIQYDDFTKLDIRVATITAAEKVKKADRLLHITLDVGSETREVVSGIAEHYAPEDIVGQQVTYLANLAPRTLKKIESSGMILMAEDADGKLKFVAPGDATAAGSVIA